MKLAIASDLSGFPLAREIVKHLAENHPEIELIDFGIESADAQIGRASCRETV